MRIIRTAICLVLAVVLLAGCGGGAKTPARSTSAVTITIIWPTTGRGAGRVVPATVNSVLLEVFSGAVRVAHFAVSPQTGAATTSTPLNLPTGTLTIYANAFASKMDVSNNYVTDQASGLPNAPATDAPLARAVTTVTVSDGYNINFALNNTIAALLPNVPAGQIYLPVPLNSAAGSVPNALALTKLMTAKDAQGNTLLLADGALSWQVDPADPLGAFKAQIDAANPLLLDLKATGVVKLIVTDTEINPGQQPTQGIFPLEITPAPEVKVTANATQIPLSAQSVTFTLTQLPIDGGVHTPALDTPPNAPPVTPAPLTVAIQPGTSSRTQTVSYEPTGRNITLTVQAWANADGTGTLLGIYTTTIAQPTPDPVLLALLGIYPNTTAPPTSAYAFTAPLNSLVVSHPVTIN